MSNCASLGPVQTFRFAFSLFVQGDSIADLKVCASPAFTVNCQLSTVDCSQPWTGSLVP